jgi:hypothetical protein
MLESMSVISQRGILLPASDLDFVILITVQDSGFLAGVTRVGFQQTSQISFNT